MSMSDPLIKQIEYYIDAEQDLSKKGAIRLMLSEYLTFKKIIIEQSNQIAEMEKAFNQGKVNPILMKEHQELQKEYNKLLDKISRISKITDEG